ncbi:hypothetical protein [uncultured Sulfitobacter sp.]|uniref:hypothetical protein n=1 Tax=uncultured Sulfitobacter sp. TaxID=191468 RepID=UPI00261B6DBB|nr:hypothetical protein [uncultured Sulfitobacter sp.]
MKPLIVCSVHALCDIAELERKAFNRACGMHGIPAVLTPQDHAKILATKTMLDLLSHLPGSVEQREALVSCFLDMLNDAIWNASVSAHNSVLATLLCPKGYARPTGFVSDYPMLTTNLVRASALLTNATKLGALTALSDPLKVARVEESLLACATSLNFPHQDIEVLIAHERDVRAARSIGMQPRFVAELRRETKSKRSVRQLRTRIHDAAIIDTARAQKPFAVPA